MLKRKYGTCNIWDILIQKQNNNNNSVLYFYLPILATLVIPSTFAGEKGGHWVERNEEGKVETGEVGEALGARVGRAL